MYVPQFLIAGVYRIIWPFRTPYTAEASQRLMMERIPEFAANHLLLVTLFFALLIMLLWSIFGNAMTGVMQVSPAEATRLLNREGAIIVDIRPESDYGSGHILNAVSIPASELEAREAELSKHRGKPVVVYCRNGSTAGPSVRLLKSKGFEKVYSLAGGLEAWRSASLPVSRNSH